MSNTTQVNLYLKNPNGTPMTNTCVTVKPLRAGFWSGFAGIVEDTEMVFKTDNQGYIAMALWPLPYPYYLTYSDDDESMPGQFLFYVPAVDYPVAFEDLIVTKADSNDKYADTILQQIIAAKVAAVESASEAEASATEAAGSATAAAASEATSTTNAQATQVDRTQVNQMLSDMTTLWTNLQEAIVKIQAINLQNKLKLGGYTLWVDASGKLRIFEGNPTSDTAGVVVGTQTA